jgi:hypothetical protein
LEIPIGAHISVVMNLPREHHYNPKFILKRWTINDGPLCEMRLIRDKVLTNHRYPGATGKLRDLYRTDGVSEANSQDVELHFMSPLDNDAAVSLDKFVAAQPLDASDRIAWARFVLSMLYRNPECVALIKSHMAEVWAEGTDALEGDWAALRGPLDQMTLAEATEIRQPSAAEISASNMLVDVIANERAVPDIANMHWTRVELSRSKYSLLTSDRPLVMPVGLGHRQCYIALPVGPRHLFVAAHDDRFSRLLPTADHTKIAKLMNKDVVRQARQYVWGQDDSQLEFVRKHFATLPDREILTEAQRQAGISAARGLLPLPRPPG